MNLDFCFLQYERFRQMEKFPFILYLSWTFNAQLDLIDFFQLTEQDDCDANAETFDFWPRNPALTLNIAKGASSDNLTLWFSPRHGGADTTLNLDREISRQDTDKRLAVKSRAQDSTLYPINATLIYFNNHL